jgi:hemolysin activation/secretion protein
MNASRRDDENLSRYGGDPYAGLLRASTTIQQDLPWGARASVRLQGQYTPRQLLVPEQMSLGNLSIVRGYQPSELLGDTVIANAVEVKSPSWRIPLQSKASAFVFADSAALWNRGPLGDRRWAASRGVGLALSLPNGIEAQVTWADTRRVGPIPSKGSLLVTLHTTLTGLGPFVGRALKSFGNFVR